MPVASDKQLTSVKIQTGKNYNNTVKPESEAQFSVYSIMALNYNAVKSSFI